VTECEGIGAAFTLVLECRNVWEVFGHGCGGS
jgi:hypothetical protein